MAPRSLLGPQPPRFLGTDDPWMRVPGHEDVGKPKPKAKDHRNWQQKTRDWLNEKGRKYLGPHAPSLGLLGAASEFTDAADLRDAMDYGGKMGGAVQRGDWWGAAGAAPWMLAASAAAMLPGASLGATDEVAEGAGKAIMPTMKKASPNSMAQRLAKMIDEAGIGKFEFDGDVYKTTSIEHSRAAGSKSTYLHFERPRGDMVTVRISDHSNAPNMGAVRRDGSRQEIPAIDLRPGDDLNDVVARLKAYFEDSLHPDEVGRLPRLKPAKGKGASLGAADEAAERGAKILDMLKAGKAKKITDDMLDMGDPVLNARLNDYLFKNYDLPMDEASRMARAQDAGFAGPTYHATGESFVAVDPRRADTGMSFGTGERAFWTTTQPKTADTYLSGAWVRAGNGGAPVGDGVERYYTAGSNVIPTLNRITNADEWDMGGGLYRASDVSRAIKEARKDKSDSVVFKHMKDQGIMGLGSGSSENISVAAIDPTSVRARFARFDPRLRHLRNLNASIAAALLGYGTLNEFMPEEDLP